jgi:hypothetical protein
MSCISQKRPVGARRLGRLGGELGVLVDVGQRQVAEHVAHVVAEAHVQLADDAGRLAAERALEVAVLDERHRGVDGPADVVALRVDRAVEEQRQRRGPLAAQHRGEPEHGQAGERGEYSGDQHADRRLVAHGLAVEGEPGDQQRHGEADARQRGAAEHLPLADAAGQHAEPQPQREQRAAADPDQLPGYEAGHDAPRHPR